jgi:hypothetical protein
MFIGGILTTLLPILSPCVSVFVIVINAMEEIFKSVFEISKICVRMLFKSGVTKGIKVLNKIIMKLLETTIYL